MLRIVFTLTPVSGTGTGFGPLPSRERGNVVGLSYSPSPHPVDSRLRGNDGPWWLCCLVVALPCGYCLKASMTAVQHCPSGLRIKSAMTVLMARMTVGFAKVSIKGEGELVVVLSCCMPHPVDTALKPV